MTLVPPNEVPTLGDKLTVEGKDANGNSSLIGLTAPAWSIADTGNVFAFVAAADGSSATIIPNSGVVGTAVVTYTTTDSTGATLTATWDAEVLPGPAVSVSISATPIPAPVPAALEVAPTSEAVTVGSVVSDQLVASGGVAPYTFSGDLAAIGLAVDAAGLITGTVSQVGVASVTLTDSTGATTSVAVSAA